MTQVLEFNLKQVGIDADNQRLMLGRKALLAYDGEPTQILKIKNQGDPDDNVCINYASVIVSKGVSFLFGDDLDIEVGTENEDTAGEDLLDKVWPADRRSEDLVDLATNGGIFGNGWLKIALTDGAPDVVILDPQNMSAQWDPQNYKRVVRYRNQYNTIDEAGRPIIWREDCERDGQTWVIKEYWSRPDASNWILVQTTMWPFPFAPVFQCKNLAKPNEFYGRADLSRFVLATIHYLQRVDSLINRILRVHAYPKPVGRGLSKQDLKMSTDEILFLPDKEQSIELLEMTGDLDGAQKFRKQLREALAEVSHVPEVSTSKTEGIGQLSGRALILLYGPLIDQTKQKRRTYGPLVKDLIRALLTIAGKPDQEVRLNWPEMLPGDEKEKADTALVKRKLGVSEDTLMRELGYDPDQEREKSKQNQQDLGDQLLKQFDAGMTGNQDAG